MACFAINMEISVVKILFLINLRKYRLNASVLAILNSDRVGGEWDKSPGSVRCVCLPVTTDLSGAGHDRLIVL